MGSHKGREGQGARKVYHDRRLASPLTTWFTVRTIFVSVSSS
jgi:hypothetical protein